MVTLSEAVRAQYPWQGTTFDVDGGQMHVLDEGPRDGEVLLCVHGNPERVARLVVTNTAAFRSQAIPLSIASCRIPGFGALAVRGGNAFARVATWRATAKGLSSTAKAGLLAPYDSWANRIATLRFVEDIPLNPSHPSYDALLQTEQGIDQFTETPTLMCWGDDDFCFTPDFRKEWEERLPSAEVHAWEDVGHYVMEDAPDRVEGLLRAFLAAHPLSERA